MTVTSVARGIRWYVRGLMGDDAYEKYLAHVAAQHGDGGAGGGTRVMTEREFWRDRTDRRDANPEGRCC
jgi:uncharacterized short protein YbdD (DUF466 family)